MTHLLPPSLLKLFEPRPPLPYLKPTDRDPNLPSRFSLEPISRYLDRIREDQQEESDRNDPEQIAKLQSEPVPLVEEEARKLRWASKKKEREDKFKTDLSNYNPKQDPNAVGDPYKTLFISRLSYEATEDDLRREFSSFGPIERMKIIRDKKGKSRGYAFILYDREKDMKAAYKEADGIKILGKRIQVDVERGRTVKDWKPMRLGGGLGGRTKVAPLPEPVSSKSRLGGGGGGGGGRRDGGGMRNGGGGRSGGRGGGGGRRDDFRDGGGRGPPRGPPRGAGLGYDGPPKRSWGNDDRGDFKRQRY